MQKLTEVLIVSQKDLQQKKLFQALGTGISNGIKFNEIVILNKNQESPILILLVKLRKF